MRTERWTTSLLRGLISHALCQRVTVALCLKEENREEHEREEKRSPPSYLASLVSSSHILLLFEQSQEIECFACLHRLHSATYDWGVTKRT
jgi:hypothetical protein